MNEMAIQATAAEAVDKVVTEHLLTIIKETGVPVRVLDMSLGRANPPDAILHQRVETAAVAAAASGRFSEPPACYRGQAR